jgi:hypothetical protein
VHIDGWFWIFSTVWVSLGIPFPTARAPGWLVFVGYSTKWWWQHRAESDICVSFDLLDPSSLHSTRMSKFRIEREWNSLQERHFVPRWSSRRIDTAHVDSGS